MPRRTNQFQDLIDLLERQIAATSASVEASKLFTDGVTGEEREVDIVIEHKSGIHPVCIGIEVIAHKRPASSTWIEAISAKHRDLPIDKSIAVSKSGYYKPALRKAEALNMDALTLREATELDWPSKLDSIPRVRIEAFLVPYLTHVSLVFYKEESLRKFSGVDMWNLPLFTSNGKSRGTVKELLDNLLASREFIAAVKQKAYTDSATAINAELRFEDGSYAESHDHHRHPLRSVKFEATCKRVVSDAALQKGRYRDVAVALASGSALGHDLQMAFSQRQDDESPIVGVRIKKHKAK